MLIIRNDKFRVSSYCTIHELVVIRIGLNKVKPKFNFYFLGVS